MKQTKLFDTNINFSYTLEGNNLLPVKVSFRDIVPEITDTSILRILFIIILPNLYHKLLDFVSTNLLQKMTQ